MTIHKYKELYKGKTICARRIDTRDHNKWEILIDNKVSGRANSPGGALSRAKGMIDSANSGEA